MKWPKNNHLKGQVSDIYGKAITTPAEQRYNDLKLQLLN